MNVHLVHFRNSMQNALRLLLLDMLFIAAGTITGLVAGVIAVSFS